MVSRTRERAGTIRLWAGVLLVLLLATGGSEARAEVIRGLDFQLGAGYRQDQIDWNIAGTPQGADPNILSELKWDDLEIYQVRAQAKVVAGLDNFPYFDTCVKGSIGYGWIVDGENQDSDYLGDNRTLEFSRSNNKTEDDDVFDASLAIGPQFRAGEEKVIITPLVGWSHHEQNLRITDGFQTIPDLGAFPGLNSTYETEWSGPWVGIDLEARLSRRLTITGSAEYHWADYEAEANWNLRDRDFILPDGSILPALAHPKSFEHKADGEGIILSATASVDLAERWSLELSYDYQDWQTDHGVDRVFIDSPSLGRFVGVTRLNEVNWESQAVMLGVTYRFF